MNDSVNISNAIKKETFERFSKNNLTVLMSGFFFITALFLLFVLSAETIIVLFSALSAFNYIFAIFVTVILSAIIVGTAILISPIINGYIKNIYDISKCYEVTFHDMFFFFKQDKNSYLKTIKFNLCILLRIFINLLIYLLPITILIVLTLNDLNKYSNEFFATIAINIIKITYSFLIATVLFTLISRYLCYFLCYTEFPEMNLKECFNISKKIIIEHNKYNPYLFLKNYHLVALSFLIIPAFYCVPKFMACFTVNYKWLIINEKQRMVKPDFMDINGYNQNSYTKTENF